MLETQETVGEPGGAQRLSFWERIAPALGLFLLASLVGEFLLGNVSIEDIVALLFLAPLYGGGALLIREVTRRTRRGWPTILLLGLAYGLLEAGLFDKSLFNSSYEGLDLTAAYIPAFGISAHYSLAFIVGHAVWSISVPIAIVEGLVPDRSTTPWLGKIGLAVTAVLYMLGGFLISIDSVRAEHFLPSAAQLIAAGVVALALIATAFAVGRKSLPKIDSPAPNPWLVGAAALVASSLFFALVANWLGVAIGIALIAVMSVLVARWSRHKGWGAAHRLALASGAILTYGWGSFAVRSTKGQQGIIPLVGNLVLIVAAIVLLVLAARKVHKV